MVRFLVENGACLFAATLSDHETPAEKCEEDEEGFDGCSEYLYSKLACVDFANESVFHIKLLLLGIQEKLGILNNGEVYAVFSYDAQQQDELGFNVNDRLTILRKGDETEREWWWARNGLKEGYVPRNLFGVSIYYPRYLLRLQMYILSFLNYSFIQETNRRRVSTTPNNIRSNAGASPTSKIIISRNIMLLILFKSNSSMSDCKLHIVLNIE